MPQKKHSIIAVISIILGLAIFLTLTIAIVFQLMGFSSGLSFNKKIGIVPIEGVISDSRAVLAQLVKFEKDEGIEAIILRIDSPGGAVGPTQEIYRQVLKTVEKKRVVASLGGVAASGGYYIASAADKIVASPGTITGSIGVIMEFFRVEELLKKIGVQLEVLKSGEFKDTGSFHRELTERDRELLQNVIEDIKQQFVRGVATGRKLPVQKIEAIADGRIFTGAQALGLGLVDVLGNFQDAIDLAKELGGIKGEVNLIYPEKKKPGILDIIMETGLKALKKTFTGINNRIEYRWRGSWDTYSKKAADISLPLA